MKADQLELAEEFASRPYQIELQAYETPDGQPYFFGRVREMPGCVSDGETEQEAKANVRLAMIDFIYFLLEDGLAVPEPRTFDKFITVNMSAIEDGSTKERKSAYGSLSFDGSYNASAVSANQLAGHVYVA